MIGSLESQSRYSRDGAEVPVRLAPQFRDERVDDPMIVLLAPVGDGADHGALALEQGRDRLVDRVRGQQVGGVDRVLLPIRWQRSSAWSCFAGVQSSSRNATFDERVSVIPWPATSIEHTIS